LEESDTVLNNLSMILDGQSTVDISELPNNKNTAEIGIFNLSGIISQEKNRNHTNQRKNKLKKSISFLDALNKSIHYDYGEDLCSSGKNEISFKDE
jgi:hypothetical protein